MAQIPDHFNTIGQPAFGEYKEKGSKFMAYAFRMDDESQLSAYMEAIKDEHPKARHYCYAWKLGTDNNRFRANDDGEPSGTAGKPILNQIMSHGLTNILVVVVRYFGGTKLGASGLIKAYKEATDEALKNSTKVEDFITETYRLEFDYNDMGHIMNAVKSLDIEVSDKNFNEAPSVLIKIRKNDALNKIKLLKALILKVSPDEISSATTIPFCKIVQSD